MKVISFLTLTALLAMSSCSHFSKCCGDKEKCAKEKDCKEKSKKDCKDDSCSKDKKKAKKS